MSFTESGAIIHNTLNALFGISGLFTLFTGIWFNSLLNKTDCISDTIRTTTRMVVVLGSIMVTLCITDIFCTFYCIKHINSKDVEENRHEEMSYPRITFYTMFLIIALIGIAQIKQKMDICNIDSSNNFSNLVELSLGFCGLSFSLFIIYVIVLFVNSRKQKEKFDQYNAYQQRQMLRPFAQNFS